MTALSVNVNKVALLRNSRDSGIPSVLRAAEIAIAAGADGITVHPRPDKRHIRRSDVYDLIRTIPVELNIEGNPLEPEFMELVTSVKPAQCTLVPDARDQFTSDHGWDLPRQADQLQPIIRELKDKGIRVSVFMDADATSWDIVKDLGADRVELYTGPYAEEFTTTRKEKMTAQYTEAGQQATAAGLGINAGHDLNLENLGPFLQAVPGVLEVSIGHALVADALEFGLAATVQKYRAICRADARG